MRQLIASLVFIALPGTLFAQTAKVRPPEIGGHFIGESVAEFLRIEPEVQQEVNVCEQHPSKTICDRLLVAVKRGQRTDVSTSSSVNFVLDGGKVVKARMFVNDLSDAVKTDLTEKFGPRSSETAFPMLNAMGASWEDHIYVWDTPTAYAALHEDNNPTLQSHHFVLVVESPAEHAREYADAVKQ
jgi:hypothetical protein